jgi:hypothetical protein
VWGEGVVSGNGLIQGLAVYRCKQKQVNICDWCCARMVGEWNQANGIC